MIILLAKLGPISNATNLVISFTIEKFRLFTYQLHSIKYYGIVICYNPYVNRFFFQNTKTGMVVT